MASLFAMENGSQVKRMILLAPAINLIGATPQKKRTVNVPVRIYHGRDDRVIPLEEVSVIAKKIFSDLAFNTVDDDHFLHKTFKTIDWDTLLV